MTCEKRKARDQVWRCAPCGLAWDADDPEPPRCPRDAPAADVDPLRQTVAGMAFQAEAAGQQGDAAAKARMRALITMQSRLFGAAIGQQAYTALCVALIEHGRTHPRAMNGLVAFTAVAEIARQVLDVIVSNNEADPSQREALRETLTEIVKKTTHPHFKPEMYADGTSPNPR